MFTLPRELCQWAQHPPKSCIFQDSLDLWKSEMIEFLFVVQGETVGVAVQVRFLEHHHMSCIEIGSQQIESCCSVIIFQDAITRNFINTYFIPWGMLIWRPAIIQHWKKTKFHFNFPFYVLLRTCCRDNREVKLGQSLIFLPVQSVTIGMWPDIQGFSVNSPCSETFAVCLSELGIGSMLARMDTVNETNT